MARLTLELPVHEKQRGFNLRRWAELLADRELARIEGRIETDRYGRKRRRQRSVAVCLGWRDKFPGADSDAVLEAVPAVPETGSVPLTWNLCARRGKSLDERCLFPLRRIEVSQ